LYIDYRTCLQGAREWENEWLSCGWRRGPVGSDWVPMGSDWVISHTDQRSAVTARATPARPRVSSNDQRSRTSCRGLASARPPPKCCNLIFYASCVSDLLFQMPKSSKLSTTCFGTTKQTTLVSFSLAHPILSENVKVNRKNKTGVIWTICVE